MGSGNSKAAALASERVRKPDSSRNTGAGGQANQKGTRANAYVPNQNQSQKETKDASRASTPRLNASINSTQSRDSTSSLGSQSERSQKEKTPLK